MLYARPLAPTRPREVAFESLVYSVLALAVLWPLPTALASAVPMGTEHVATVPFAMAWSFWWQADRIAHGFVDFWQAPIFFPTESTFALSETNTLGSFLMAPVVLATGSAALGHNLFLLLCLALNGLTTSRFLQSLGLHRWVAVMTGVGVLMLPLPHQEIGVLPLVPVWGVVASLHALWRWTQEPSLGRGAVVGLALAATYLMCFQYALFLAVVLGLLGWLHLERRHLRPRAVASLVLAAGLAGACVAPVVVAQLDTVKSESGFKRKEKKVRKLAAKPRHYLRTPWKQAVPVPGIGVAKKPGWKAFHPGTGRVALALAGLVWGLGLATRVRWAWFFGAGALLSYAMSLGPWVEFMGVNLWQVSIDVLPGYGKVRSLSRWAVFVQLFVLLLAGFGLQAIRDQLDGRPPQGADGGVVPARGGKRLVAAVALLLLGGVTMFEVVPTPQELREVPSLEANQGWGRWIQAHTPDDAVLAFLPFSDGGNVDDYEKDAEWMMLGPVYRRTTVNGYSSYFPRTFRKLKKQLKEFPTDKGVAGLRSLGVTHVVMEQEVLPEHLIADYPSVAEALTVVFRDDVAGVDIYELN